VFIKTCARCKENLSVSLFRLDSRYSDGYASWCKACFSENNKINYIQKRKWRDIEKRYGITKEEYKKLEKKQNNLCACCKQKPQNRGRNDSFVVDHCHATGRVRGLLCAKCNAGIGFFDDTPALLVLASEYLQKHDYLSCKHSPC
jgi:hypothetical protein